ncbi:MAG: hypothetical protein QNJ33_13365 [Crocosphaera sp.]|nr:hypothetical protein [Crocosphaera sp.]
MRHSYRHYRQVKIINNSRQTSPQIDGFEEIVCDGKRQVYYWNNPTDWYGWDDSDFLVSSLIDPDDDWFNTDELSPGVRYLNPNEVIIRDLTNFQTKRQHQNSKLSQIKTSIQKGINKIKKIAKRLPLALNVAWRELTSEH